MNCRLAKKKNASTSDFDMTVDSSEVCLLHNTLHNAPSHFVATLLFCLWPSVGWTQQSTSTFNTVNYLYSVDI